ncbi:winged helix-turn-helix domain-containing protein [Thalassospira xiamenensis]|uniref:DNA-binding response regulator, OmpR family, contains REC and winged-helix (WHTH) domain n=1 Tax=Thalassospira xiamenensis TaxID=220697 RepID=A0A285TZK3_9PROT|nr:winged helix-turn-helix domain-containing protein [Thalassospira xiamenensis]SOC31037.1 DNA-binding response regulator, OmpR family, contains REC and winged-helix (wHTH) domain [Thalassospira xiamenensis]
MEKILFIGESEYIMRASRYISEIFGIQSTPICMKNISNINDVTEKFTLLVFCQESSNHDLIYSLFQKIDQDGRKRSVIIHGEISDEIMIDMLNAGAINCISAHESLPVIAAKLKAALRTVIATSQYVIQIGKFLYYSKDQFLLNTASGEKTRLQNRQNQILKYMVRNRGRSVTVDELQTNIWGYSRDTDTHAAEMGIYRLRSKIEENRKDPKILIRQNGGYFLSDESNDL